MHKLKVGIGHQLDRFGTYHSRGRLYPRDSRRDLERKAFVATQSLHSIVKLENLRYEFNGPLRKMRYDVQGTLQSR